MKHEGERLGLTDTETNLLLRVADRSVGTILVGDECKLAGANQWLSATLIRGAESVLDRVDMSEVRDLSRKIADMREEQAFALIWWVTGYREAIGVAQRQLENIL